MKNAFTALLLSLAAFVAPAFAQESAGLADVAFPLIPELEHPVGVEVLFGPRDDIEGRIIKAIRAAKTEILINHYIVTNTRIMDALKAAKARKVLVVALLDSAPAVNNYQGFRLLKQRGVATVPLKRAADRWNNAKYMIIDRTRVLTGTPDLTNSATRNDEVLFVLEEPSITVSFYNHFVKQVFPTAVKPDETQ